VDNVRSTEVEPLEFRYRLGETDVVDLQRCYDRLMVGRPIRRLVVIFATVLAALCLWSILAMGPRITSVLMLVAWAYLLLVLPFERDWHARWRYRRRVAEFLETQVTLSEDRVATENESGRSDFRWGLVGLIADVPAGLLFCNKDRRPLFWLPGRLFEGNRQREQVLTLAKCNQVRIQRSSRF
jgi:hypothetical protein